MNSVEVVSVAQALSLVKSSKNSHKVFIIPVGGCGEFGINLTLYCFSGQYFIVDCGLMFPDEAKLGVDAIIPDVTPIMEILGKPSAYLITHDHEDHIGALSFIHSRWSAPIYTTRWTVELIRARFMRAGIPPPEINLVKPNDKLLFGEVSASWVHVNHSIPDCCSLVLDFSGKKIVHTGDFKFDDKSMYETPLKESDFQALLPDGADLLLADSTNSVSAGDCPSEADCLDTFHKVFSRQEGHIYVATFASNFWRVRSLMTAAKEAGRLVHFAGRGLENTVEIARRLGMFPENYDNLISEGELHRAASENRKLVVICTGCQGESLAALARIIRGDHRKFRLTSDDCVVFSSRIIPGSERAVYSLMSECARQNVEVISHRQYEHIHVSGHAYQGDLKRMFNATKPRNILTVHGSYTHLCTHRDLFLEAEPSASLKSAIQGQDGVVYQLDENGSFCALCQFDIEWIYIDSGSRLQLNRSELKQRLKIGELGLVVFSGVYSKKTESWLGEVFFDLRGLDLPLGIAKDDWIDRQSKHCLKIVRNFLGTTAKTGHDLNEEVRIAMRQNIAKTFIKKVVVVANIHVV